MKVCVLIPACNGGRTIGGLVQNLFRYIGSVIVVDDGSYDDTYVKAKDAGAVVLKHDKNRGKGAALRTGFKYAVGKGYDGIITMDADGQHDWREVPLFISEAEKGDADIILGTRMRDCEGMPFVRLLTNVVISRIVSFLTSQKITDSQMGYRLIRREVLENISLITSNYDMESEILLKAAEKGFRITEIPVKTIYGGQTSKINSIVDTFRFFKLILRTAAGGLLASCRKENETLR